MNRSGFWAYLMARQEAGVMAGATQAAHYAPELPVPAEGQTNQTLPILPLLQARCGRPAYDGLLRPNEPTAIRTIAQAGTGTIVKLTNHSQWALTLVNYMPQSCQRWMPADRVTIAADDQSYLLYNHRLHAVLRVLYLGQEGQH
jgi:hypothetical protein